MMINKKIIESIIIYIYIMGYYNTSCDYYIIKQLEINFINSLDEHEVKVIELKRKSCYFEYDLDNNDSCDEIDEHIYSFSNYNRRTSNEIFYTTYNRYLKVTFMPRILFSECKWKNENIKKKYENLVFNEIGNGCIILDVIKKEVRQLS